MSKRNRTNYLSPMSSVGRLRCTFNAAQLVIQPAMRSSSSAWITAVRVTYLPTPGFSPIPVRLTSSFHFPVKSPSNI